MIPVIPGLFAELTYIICERGDARYTLSMVAKDWNVYCINNMGVIENTESSIDQNCREYNVLEIVRNHRRLNAEFVMKGACRYNVGLLMKIIIRIGIKQYNHGMCVACYGGHMDIIEYMMMQVDDKRGLFEYVTSIIHKFISVCWKHTD
jgi:hypothetical protein